MKHVSRMDVPGSNNTMIGVLLIGKFRPFVPCKFRKFGRSLEACFLALEKEYEYDNSIPIYSSGTPQKENIADSSRSENTSETVPARRPANRRVHFSPIIDTLYRTRSGRLIRRPNSPGTIFY